MWWHTYCPYCHEHQDVFAGHQGNGELERGAQKDAAAKDPLAPKLLRYDAADELRGDVAEREAAQHQALCIQS